MTELENPTNEIPVSAENNSSTESTLDAYDDSYDDTDAPLAFIEPADPPKKVRIDWLIEDFHEQASSVYEAIMVASHRARQIGRQHKQEIDNWTSAVEALESEGQIDENSDAGIDHFHHSKPTIKALSELKKNKLEYRYRDEIEE